MSNINAQIARAAATGNYRRANQLARQARVLKETQAKARRVIAKSRSRSIQ